MSILQVNGALVQAYKDLNLSLPTAYEARDFKVPADTAWAAVFNLPASLAVDTLGDDGLNRYVGLFQIDFHSRDNSGTAVLLNYADTVIAAFPPGKRVSYEDQEVRLRRVSPTPIRRGEGSAGYVISLSVYWEAWMQRDATGYVAIPAVDPDPVQVFEDNL